MMTITIAAITIGIAVDNSIHYIYRFKEEFKKIKDYNKTLNIVIQQWYGYTKHFNNDSFWIFNFSVLKLYSNNLFCSVYRYSYVIAMISVLTLLPALILNIKPFQTKLMEIIKRFF